MKKKIFLMLVIVAMLVCAFAITASAKSVYLEPIPDELKAQNDSFTHFVVFEEEKYFTGSGNTINGLNDSVMDQDMAAAGIDKSKIGTEYLTRYNFPAYMDDTLITYVNLNVIKTHKYFNSVCGYIQLEGTVNQVHDMNDCVSELRCIDFGENSQVTRIPLCFANFARKMASVKNFPRNLTYIGRDAFNSCYGGFRGELYINAETIEMNAFNNAISNVTHLILGPDVKNIGTQALTVLFAVNHQNEIPAYYAPADLKPALVSIEFQCDVSQMNFANQGRDSGAFYFPVATARSPYEKLESIILSHPNNAKYVTEGSIFNDFTAEGVNILFNDSDGLDDYVTAKHNFSILDDVSYESYTEEGKKAMKCADCGAITYKSAAPLFVCLGYSAPESDKLGIAIEYKVNKDAIKEYEEATGKSFSYGVFAVSKTKLDGNEIFTDGVATSGVISTELSSFNFTTVVLKITGFKDEHKTKEFALGVYTSFDGAYGYIQENATVINNAYVFTSYNAIVDGINKKNEVA
jgi:hypothetical protein